MTERHMAYATKGEHDMKTKTYATNHGITIVEECTRKEFAELACELVSYFEFSDSLGILTDQTLSIDYHDGKSLYCGDYYGIEGSFRKGGIAFGVIDNGSTYQVTGNYTIDDNGILERA